MSLLSIVRGSRFSLRCRIAVGLSLRRLLLLWLGFRNGLRLWCRYLRGRLGRLAGFRLHGFLHWCLCRLLRLSYWSRLRSGLFLGLADGSSLWLRFLLNFCSTRRLCHRLANAVEVNLSQWLVLLLRGRLEQALCPVVLSFRSTFLVLSLFLEQSLRLVSHGGILLERLNERRILRIADLRCQFKLLLSNIASFLKEFNCRLKSYVQLT